MTEPPKQRSIWSLRPPFWKRTEKGVAIENSELVAERDGPPNDRDFSVFDYEREVAETRLPLGLKCYDDSFSVTHSVPTFLSLKENSSTKGQEEAEKSQCRIELERNQTDDLASRSSFIQEIAHTGKLQMDGKAPSHIWRGKKIKVNRVLNPREDPPVPRVELNRSLTHQNSVDSGTVTSAKTGTLQPIKLQTPLPDLTPTAIMLRRSRTDLTGLTTPSVLVSPTRTWSMVGGSSKGARTLTSQSANLMSSEIPRQEKISKKKGSVIFPPFMRGKRVPLWRPSRKMDREEGCVQNQDILLTSGENSFIDTKMDLSCLHRTDAGAGKVPVAEYGGNHQIDQFGKCDEMKVAENAEDLSKQRAEESRTYIELGPVDSKGQLTEMKAIEMSSPSSHPKKKKISLKAVWIDYSPEGVEVQSYADRVRKNNNVANLTSENPQRDDDTQNCTPMADEKLPKEMNDRLTNAMTPIAEAIVVTQNTTDPVATEEVVTKIHNMVTTNIPLSPENDAAILLCGSTDGARRSPTLVDEEVTYSLDDNANGDSSKRRGSDNKLGTQHDKNDVVINEASNIAASSENDLATGCNHEKGRTQHETTESGRMTSNKSMIDSMTGPSQANASEGKSSPVSQSELFRAFADAERLPPFVLSGKIEPPPAASSYQYVAHPKRALNLLELVAVVDEEDPKADIDIGMTRVLTFQREKKESRTCDHALGNDLTFGGIELVLLWCDQAENCVVAQEFISLNYDQCRDEEANTASGRSVRSNNQSAEDGFDDKSYAEGSQSQLPNSTDVEELGMSLLVDCAEFVTELGNTDGSKGFDSQSFDSKNLVAMKVLPLAKVPVSSRNSITSASKWISSASVVANDVEEASSHEFGIQCFHEEKEENPDLKFLESSRRSDGSQRDASELHQLWSEGLWYEESQSGEIELHTLSSSAIELGVLDQGLHSPEDWLSVPTYVQVSKRRKKAPPKNSFEPIDDTARSQPGEDSEVVEPNDDSLWLQSQEELATTVTPTTQQEKKVVESSSALSETTASSTKSPSAIQEKIGYISGSQIEENVDGSEPLFGTKSNELAFFIEKNRAINAHGTDKAAESFEKSDASAFCDKAIQKERVNSEAESLASHLIETTLDDATLSQAHKLGGLVDTSGELNSNHPDDKGGSHPAVSGPVDEDARDILAEFEDESETRVKESNSQEDDPGKTADRKRRNNAQKMAPEPDSSGIVCDVDAWRMQDLLGVDLHEVSAQVRVVGSDLTEPIMREYKEIRRDIRSLNRDLSKAAKKVHCVPDPCFLCT